MYDDDGNAIIKYPEIWIERGVLGFIPFVTSQDDLDVDNVEEVIDAEEVKVDDETGEVIDEDIREAITDEPEDDEETEI